MTKTMSENIEKSGQPEQSKAIAQVPEKKGAADVITDFLSHPLVAGSIGAGLGYYFGKSNNEPVNDIYKPQADRLRNKLKAAEKTIDVLKEENRQLHFELSEIKLKQSLEQAMGKISVTNAESTKTEPKKPLRYLKNEKYEFQQAPGKAYIKLIIDD
jgi:hypothetical protein